MHVESLEPRALLTVTLGDPILSDTVEIDDNVVVQDGSRSITATGGPSSDGHVQIFGNSRGRIDGTTGQSDEDLSIVADTFITVTGGIGATHRIDDLTLTSQTAQPVNLQQAVSLTGDLRVTNAGSFTIGSTVDIDGNLTIDAATNVMFSGNVTVDGNLTITNATSVLFAGTLTVGGQLTIVNVSGSTRFAGDVSVGAAAVTSTSLVQVQANFGSTGAAGDGDVTFTTDQVGFTTGTIQSIAVSGPASAPSATLTVKPRTLNRALTIASPPGTPAGLNITDADLTAIQAGWKRVVLGDEVNGTGAVRIGSIGSQYGGFSQILNTTTIVGGTIQVVQPVDVTPDAAYLELIARGTGSPGTGALTINAPINQTAEERNAWVRLTSAGSISINAPIWATETVSLTTTAGGTITQGGSSAAISTEDLAVKAAGAVTLADAGNAVDIVAFETSDATAVFREDSGYSVGQIATTDSARDVPVSVTVTGINAGTATVRLVTVSGATTSSVTQTHRVLAGALGLEGTGTAWTLTDSANDLVGILAANTGSVEFRDFDDLTIGTVAAVTPQSTISGITVARTLDVTAGTSLTITVAGDIVSSASSATAVNLSAASGIATAGDVTTAGGDVKFNHATTLTGDVTIDVEDGVNKGTARFLSTVNATAAGQQGLTVTGKLNAGDSIGTTTALKSLSVSNDATLAGGRTFRTTGNQTYSAAATSTGTITIQANDGSTIGFRGTTSLDGLVTATATGAAAYHVELTGSSVTVANAVTFANSGTVMLGDGPNDDLHFVGGVTSTAPATTKLAGTVRTTDAAGSFGRKPGGVVELIANTTVTTGLGNATFGGTVDGPYRLVVNATGDTTFSSAVGGITALAHLETDAPGRTLLDGGSVRTASPSSQVYNDDVLLGANTVLTAENGGGVTFVKTLNGGYTLAVNTTGTTTFGGMVGNGTPLKSLSTDALGTTRIHGGSVITNDAGGQSYGDDVVLGVADATLAAGVGTVTFHEKVDSATAGEYGLTVSAAGQTTFHKNVGTTALEYLTTTGGGTTRINGANVTTSGVTGQSYGDDVVLGVDATLTAGIGPVTFSEKVDSATAGEYGLTVSATGQTTFHKNVGTTALEYLTTTGGGTTRINGANVTTSGATGQSYGDDVVLGVDATLTAGIGPVTFSEKVDSATAGQHGLTVSADGQTTFHKDVGTTALEYLITTGGGTTRINGANVTTNGAGGQSYGDDVVLGVDATLAAGVGTVIFHEEVNSATAGEYGLTVSAAGQTTFQKNVGTTALEYLTTTGGGTTRINGTNVTTSGATGQSYGDDVVLGVDATLTAGIGPVTFSEKVDSATAGEYGLTVDATGQTTFQKNVGTTALEYLTTSGGGTTRINGANVTTSGAAGQSYGDDVVLGVDATLTAGVGTVIFHEEVNSATVGEYGLTVSAAGQTTFQKNVGTTALEYLTTNGGGTTRINGANVTTSGATGQSYGDDVVLGVDATLTAGVGTVIFHEEVNSATVGEYGLTVSAAGQTTFQKAVGTTALEYLTTSGGGTTRINGANVTTSGAAGQSYGDDVEIGVADATLAAGTGPVTFNGTIDSAVGTARALTVNSQGVTWFAGNVGVTRPLASLTTNALGSTRITAATVKTSGLQTYNDRVTFEPPVAPTGFTTLSVPQVLMIGSTVSLLQGLDAFGRSLRIEGNAVFGDQPGSPASTDDPNSSIDAVVGLNGLTVTGLTTINSNVVGSSVVAPTNPVVFQGGVTLGSDVTIFGSGIWFQSTVAGQGRTFMVRALAFGGTSSVVFDGDVGTALARLGPITVFCPAGAVNINATIYSTGPVIVAAGSIDGDADNAIRVPGSTISLTAATGIGATTPIAVQAASVTASTTAGGIRLRGIGDLVIGTPGVSAPGVISLSADGQIRVQPGATIASGQPVTATTPIRWGLLGTADAGSGSLRDVINQANATRAPGIIEFGSGPQTFVLQSALPEIATQLMIDGGNAIDGVNRIVIDGNRVARHGITFGPQAAGSLLKGVTLQNFTNYGIQLLASPSVTVQGVTVRSLNTETSMGLYATGDLTGTRVIGSTFSGGLRGAVLDNARNLVFGQIGTGLGNTLSNNLSAPSRLDFAGTGIRAQGLLTGTVVAGNHFTGNNYGFAFIGAQNLRLERNLFTRNNVAGIYIEGDSRGSVQTGNSFGGPRQDRNKAHVLRARGSQFGGRPVVPRT